MRKATNDHADRNHGDDAERGIEPAAAKQRVVGGVVHEGDDAHPQVAEHDVHRPFHERGVRRPREHARHDHQAEKQRDLGEVRQDARGGQARQVSATQSWELLGIHRLSRGRANALRGTIHDQCTVAHTDNRTSQSPRADTFLGPAFLGFGYGGAGGDWSLYLLLGAP